MSPYLGLTDMGTYPYVKSKHTHRYSPVYDIRLENPDTFLGANTCCNKRGSTSMCGRSAPQENRQGIPCKTHSCIHACKHLLPLYPSPAHCVFTTLSTMRHRVQLILRPYNTRIIALAKTDIPPGTNKISTNNSR